MRREACPIPRASGLPHGRAHLTATTTAISVFPSSSSGVAALGSAGLHQERYLVVAAMSRPCDVVANPPWEVAGVMRLFFAADFHIMADPLGMLRGAPVRANLAETIKYINASSSQNIDQVVVGGDLSHDGTTASYDYVHSQLQLLQCTYHLIPGNHDTNADLRSGFEALPRSLILSSGWMLHLIDSRLPEVQEGAISPSSLQYLQDHLSGPRQGHVVALHHDIFQPNTPARPGIVSGAWDFLKMVGEASAAYKIVVSGHRHQHAVMALCGALFVNSGAVSCQFEFSTGQLAAASIQPEIVCIEVEGERAPAVSRHLIPV